MIIFLLIGGPLRTATHVQAGVTAMTVGLKSPSYLIITVKKSPLA